MPAARKPARKPAAEKHDEPKADSKPAKRTGDQAYVAVESLSWRPHALERGREVSDILPADVLDACLADGRVTREHPDD